MSQPVLNTAENTNRDRLDTFTDREAILALFEQTLQSARVGQLIGGPGSQGEQWDGENVSHLLPVEARLPSLPVAVRPDGLCSVSS